MTTYFQAEQRDYLNSAGLRNLRRAGRLPGIVFGKQAANRMIHISTIQLQKWMKLGASGFIELRFEGQDAVTVLLEDFQRDPVTRELLHVDFQQVQTGTVLRTKIPLKFKGTPIGTKQGAVVQIQRAFIEVEALPGHLPTSVEFDISGMEPGASIQVKDAVFSPDVTVISDEKEMLLSVVKP